MLSLSFSIFSSASLRKELQYFSKWLPSSNFETSSWSGMLPFSMDSIMVSRFSRACSKVNFSSFLDSDSDMDKIRSFIFDPLGIK